MQHEDARAYEGRAELVTILGWFHVGAAALALATGAVPEAKRCTLEHAMQGVVTELEAASAERLA